jgi:hypothetical protein
MPRCFRSARAFSIMRSISACTLALGRSSSALADQRVHHGLLVARQQAELDLALQVFLDVGAQAFNGGVGHAQRLGQLLVDFGQVRGFDLLHVTMKSAVLPATSLPW